MIKNEPLLGLMRYIVISNRSRWLSRIRFVHGLLAYAGHARLQSLTDDCRMKIPMRLGSDFLSM